VRHLAEAAIVHLIGRSSGRDRDALQLVWEFSRIRYVEKHFSPVKRWLMKGWIAGGIGWRLVQSLGCAPETRRLKIQSGMAVMRRLWREPQPVEQELAYSSAPHR
jgi:hypothetical protein